MQGTNTYIHTKYIWYTEKLNCADFVAVDIPLHQLQWRTEGGGCSTPPRNSEDISGVLDRIGKKNRRLDFLL